MSDVNAHTQLSLVSSMGVLAQSVDYSLLDQLNPDPHSTKTGEDYQPRQVFSGHYVPVKPTPIPSPEYIAHSHGLFQDLSFDDTFAQDPDFIRLFSGDLSQLPDPMRRVGWATGYALSIYGQEYTQQCPFRTGNGYGDGRAVSVLELVRNAQRWEMQLKGGGRTPYCRGADGRAVLRSSVREFLAQEHMHALGIPTSRSLCLFVSHQETVRRPWYAEGSDAMEPDVMVSDPVAITTRVAPSFLRVGQLELFGRRARQAAHPGALEELEMIVSHLIAREYAQDVPGNVSFSEQLICLARAFRNRLCELVSHWLRVGYCQGNFNSDNCAAGGFTLDYGPFGFCEQFDPFFQPWIGGGQHFSFMNQPAAASANFDMFCGALEPLLQDDSAATKALEEVRGKFGAVMQAKLESMWASKLGLADYDAQLVGDLLVLMQQNAVDYNMFFRELSDLPESTMSLEACFYRPVGSNQALQWSVWFKTWRGLVRERQDDAAVSQRMKQVNPKYTWREWLVVPAYQQASRGDYSRVRDLQTVWVNPYDEQSPDQEQHYYRLRPAAFFEAGGVSHYSCSS